MLSLVCSVLSLVCLIYVPICAIVALALSLAGPGDGKMARGEERVSRFCAAYVVIPMLFLLSAAVLAVFRKWRLALYGLAVFVLFWFLMASGYLWYWK